MKRLVALLALAGVLSAASVRAQDYGAVAELQQVLQQLVIMNGKIDALNGKLDQLNNRAYGANNQQRAFVVTIPGTFAKGPKEDGRALCANLGGTLKGAYAYRGYILVTCNY